jgi:hypothetical protein
MKRVCDTCFNDIPQARLEAIPETTTCVNCSRETKKVGFMDWYHKTAPELVMISPDNKENLRRAQRVNARSR